MNITLFSQILQHCHRELFTKAVKEYESDKHNKGINSWTHLVSMLFLHLAKANSIREVTNGLKSVTGNLNHLGIQNKTPSKSSLSYINEHRDWRLFREYYFMLKNKLQGRGHLNRKMFNKIDRKIYLLDSSVISLCLEVFDWAKYRKKKGAVKLHTLLDYDGLMPSYLFMTKGSQADVKHAQYMSMPQNSVIVADRAYQDFKLLNSWDKENIVFVLRLKKSINYVSLAERDLPEGTDEHIIKDEEIELSEIRTKAMYSNKMRRIAVFDQKNNQTIELITNNFSWTATTIAELYRQRWMIEIFFKELKSHLKIKSFIGTNENAMWVQIWTALISLLILRYLMEIAKHNWALSNLIAFLRMNLFVKISLIHWLDKPFRPPEEYPGSEVQLKLFCD
jgi:hypothetical protein